MDPTFLALSVGLPLALAAAAVATAFLARRGAPWAGLAALTLAFLAGSPAIIGRPPAWPVTQAADWLFFLALAAALIGAIDLVLPRTRWAAALLLLLLLGAAAGAYLGPLESASRRYMGEGAAKQAWIAAVFALLALPPLAARAGARHTPNAGPAFALGLLTATTIAAAFLAGSLKYAQLTALLGLGLLPLGIASLIRRPWPIDRGAVVAFSFLHATIWLLTRFYAPEEAPTSAAVLGAAAPAGLLIARIPALARRPKAAGIAQVIATLTLGAAALALTAAARATPGGQ